jgi:hypothetical protein
VAVRRATRSGYGTTATRDPSDEVEHISAAAGSERRMRTTTTRRRRR